MRFGKSMIWLSMLVALLLAGCGSGADKNEAGAAADLTVTVAGTGSVASSVAGIDCGSGSSGDCSETYASGTLVTLTATPAAGWRFVGWTGGGCNGTATCVMTMSAATTVTATFDQLTFTLSLTSVGGRVTSLPAGIDCPGDCGETYAQGTSVTLTAVPDAGQQFTGWSGGGCSGNGTCQIAMNANAGVTASFAAAPTGTFALTVGVSGAGAVTSSVGGISCPAACATTIAQNASVTLTATPSTGANFQVWGGACSGTAATCTVQMTAARAVTASFSTVNFPLTVTRAGAGTGTVTSAPAGISCGTDCAESYAQNTAVTLTAAAGSGSLFSGWSGACTGTGSCSVTMSAARNVTATFALARTLTVAKAGTGAGTVTSAPAGINCGSTCAASFADGSTVTLTAAATSGSTFGGWSGGGCSGTSTTCTTSALAAPTSVTATFSGGSALGLSTRPSNTTCFAFDPPTSTTASMTLPRAFTGLSFSEPVALLQAPGDSSRWFVVEKSGVVRVFVNSASTTTSSVFIDITAKIVTAGELEAGLLGMAFDPNFGVGAGKNQNFYLFYSGAPNSGYRLRSKISRFTANSTATSAPSNSEVNLLGLDKVDSNHNGGNLAFGPDGYLYAGFGDGGGDPNPQAQDDRFLYGKIIRINPNANTGAVTYAIPADNPNAGNGLCNAANGVGSSANCPEVWARGLRNPWRWSFDRNNGRLWVGDVGWGSFEEVNIVTKGANYGWPQKEGYCTSGCTGLTDPVYAVPRGDGQSITGGYVYRGTQTTDLAGQYIFGDFGSKMFSAVVAGSTAGSYTVRQLIAPFSANSVMPSSFGEGTDGELYVLGFDTGFIHKLTFSSGSGGGGPVVPTQLSATGCAASNPQNPSTGMVGYEINAPFWSDNAVKTRFFALPNSTASFTPGTDGDWSTPARSVFRKDFRLGGQLIETRLMMKQSNGDWAGYSYEWNTGQTDATLVAAAGKDVTIAGQTWSYPSRQQCLQCHTSVAGFSLGPETQQLNRTALYSQTGITAHQLTTLSAPAIAMLTPQISDPTTQPRMSDPFGADSVSLRARAWLHTNCSFCHRPNGPTPSSMNMLASASLAATNTCNVDPTAGNAGVLTNPKIIAPGLPDSSVLLARVNSRAALIQMPPIGSHVVDTAGVALLRSWISSLTSCN